MRRYTVTHHSTHITSTAGIPAAWHVRHSHSTYARRMVSRSGRGDADSLLGAVCHRQARLLLELGRNQAIGDLARRAEVVDLEQLRRDGVATIVSLAPLAIDADSELDRFVHRPVTSDWLIRRRSHSWWKRTPRGAPKAVSCAGDHPHDTTRPRSW